MATEEGLRARITPSIDTSEAESEVQDIEKMMEELEDLNIDMDMDAEELGEIGGAFEGAGAGGGISRGGGGGAGGGEEGGLMQRATGSGLPKLALAGAVGFGILKGVEKLAAASPALAKTASMFGEAMNLFFRPFGNEIAKELLPFAKNGLDMAKNFNEIYSEKGLEVAVMEIIPDLFEGIGETIEDAVGIDIGSDFGEQLLGGLGLAAGGMLAVKVAGWSVGSLAGTLGLGAAGVTGSVTAGSLITGTIAAGSLIVGTIAIGNYISEKTLDSSLEEILRGAAGDEQAKEDVGENLKSGDRSTDVDLGADKEGKPTGTVTTSEEGPGPVVETLHGGGQAVGGLSGGLMGLLNPSTTAGQGARWGSNQMSNIMGGERGVAEWLSGESWMVPESASKATGIDPMEDFQTSGSTTSVTRQLDQGAAQRLTNLKEGGADEETMRRVVNEELENAEISPNVNITLNGKTLAEEVERAQNANNTSVGQD